MSAPRNLIQSTRWQALQEQWSWGRAHHGRVTVVACCPCRIRRVCGYDFSAPNRDAPELDWCRSLRNGLKWLSI
jgi:hypothetical protein